MDVHYNSSIDLKFGHRWLGYCAVVALSRVQLEVSCCGLLPDNDATLKHVYAHRVIL